MRRKRTKGKEGQMRIGAFRALRPPAGLAAEVASVPYDTIGTEGARAIAKDNARSFLWIVRPEIAFPPGTDMYADAVYSRAGETLARFRREGVLVRDSAPSLYVYGQQMGSHAQYGIVACCDVDDYEGATILKHERTREPKVLDRTRLSEALGAHVGPVFLTYRSEPVVDELVERVRTRDPLFTLTADDGVIHTVWVADDVGALTRAFQAVPVAYIADGHHRAAAAAAVRSARRSRNPAHSGNEEYNRFLGVFFPANQLTIAPVHRCVRAPDAFPVPRFLESIRRVAEVRGATEPEPEAPGRAGLYVDGKWYRVSWEGVPSAEGAVEPDVAWLQNHVLKPIMGIADPADARIDFIGGRNRTAELAERVDRGEATVAFAMYPVRVEQVMAVSDAGGIMPPKSTWFEPKLRSGLFVHTLDQDGG